MDVNGKVTFDELFNYLQGKKLMYAPQLVKKVFDEMDTNRSNDVSLYSNL
jgi:hypothetical protein